MSLKRFVKSHEGRIFLTLTSMVLGSLLIAGGALTYIVYYPQSLKNTLEGQIKIQSVHWPIHDVKLDPEGSPILGLPSTTLKYQDANSNASSDVADLTTNPVGFAYSTLQTQSLNSLINTSVNNTASKTTITGAEYSFKFYSGSLQDYSSNGTYFKAAEQFFTAYNMGVSRIDFVSKPKPSGEREVTINLKTNFDILTKNSDKSEQFWRSLVEKLTDKSILGPKTIIKLTVADSKNISVKTTLSAGDDTAKTASFSPELWTTFAAYSSEGVFSFLKVSKVEYVAERTPEDSTLTVTVDKSVRDLPDLQAKIIDVSTKSEGKIVVIWSYNTYLVTADNPVPFLTFNSSSRNW